MFVDPDDWIEPDCCETVYGYANRKGLDFVLFRHFMEFEKRGAIETGVYLGNKRKYRDRIIDVSEKLLCDVIRQQSTEYGMSIDVPWGRLIRRDLIIHNNIAFQPQLVISQDGIFNLYCLAHVKEVGLMDYVGYHYRKNPHSINYRYNPCMKEYIHRFIVAAEDYCKEFGMHTERVVAKISSNNDDEFTKAMGVRCINMLGRLEETYLFHSKAGMTPSEIMNEYKSYYNDPCFNGYIKSTSLADFDRIRMKIRRALIGSGNIGIWMYYWLTRLFRVAKSKSKLLNH